jgi:hypothetical protein
VLRIIQFCRLLPILILGLQHVASAGELDEYLKLYEGRWVGYFTIHSSANGFSETFPVEQQYWLASGKLHGVAVSQRDSGMESARSTTYIVEGKLISEVTRGKEVEIFIGVRHDSGILWLPKEMERANDYQIKETFVVVHGQRLLKTDGFDTFVHGDGLAHIVYRGELSYKE